MKHFVPLETLTAEDIPFCGKKAYTLGFLINKRFPVPAGFCLLSHEFEKVFRAFASTRDFHLLPPPEQKDMSEEIESSFSAWEPPDELRSEAARIAETGICIARSSSVEEDGALHSFAGIFHSFPRLTSSTGILDAIKSVWASAWSLEAFVYREERSIAHHTSRMGVILQQEIDSKVSGVLFTRHPLTGDDEIVINAHTGRGDALVSGMNLPAMLKLEVDRASGKEKMKQESETAFPLDEAALSELVHQALEMEKLFGYPLDIEWAYDGKLYVVQARPLCGCQSWTRKPIKDFVPGVLTPLSADFFKSYLDERYRELYSNLGIRLPPREVPFFSSFEGRIYMSKTVNDLIFGQLQGEGAALSHYEHAMKLLAQLPARTRAYYDHVEENLETIHCEKEARNLWDRFKKLRQLMYQEDSVISITYLLGYLLQYFDALLPVELSPFKDCFSSISTMEHDEETSLFQKDLMLVMERIEDDEESREFLDDPENRVITPLIKGFLEKYGHWTDSPLELGKIRYREGPCLILLINIVYDRECRAQLKNSNRIREEKKRMSCSGISELGKRLKSHPAGGNLSELLKWIGFLINEREKHKRYALLITDTLRTIILRLADSLKARGFIEERDSLFNLSLDELAIVKDLESHPQCWKEHIARKGQEFRKSAEHSFPEEFEGFSPGPQYQGVPEIKEGEKLSGQPLSGGVTTACARVISEPSHMKEFRKGDIVVVAACEPCWSILFPLAAGFISETGGLLSHAAILAREYNIPAVSGIAQATRVIKTGDKITLNASEGWVMVETGDVRREM